MAKKLLITTEDGNYHKVKKEYLTVDGVYRRVKKAYTTIGGIYRPCWSSGELEYYGTIKPLSTTRLDLAAVTVGDYALFAGGYVSSDSVATSKVDVYDKSLTKLSDLDIGSSIRGLTPVSFNNHALLAGGKHVFRVTDGIQSSMSQYVRSINSSLTIQLLDNLSVARGEVRGATNSNYAIFAGGVNLRDTIQTVVDAYNKSFTRVTVTAISEAQKGAAASSDNHALFAGGVISSNLCDTIESYNTSLTKTTPTSLSIKRRSMGATSTSNHVLFGGGYHDYNTYFTSHSDVVDAYDSLLTRTVLEPLGEPRMSLGATTLDKYVLFAGGYGASSSSKAVDAYDEALTRNIVASLGASADNVKAVTVGEYALFTGEDGIVYAYTIT